MNFENQSIKKIVDDPFASGVFADFLTEKALKSHPVIKASAEQIKATNRMAKYYKRKNFVPTAAIRSSLSQSMYEGGTGPGGDNDISGMAAITLNWDVFDGDKNRVNAQKTSLEMDKLQKQKKQLENNVEFGIRSGVLDLVSKSTNINLSAKSADYAQKNLKLVQKSYNLGNASIIELLNAKNVELKAQMQYQDSVYDYLNTVVNLQADAGAFDILSSEESQKEIYEEFKKYLSKKEQGRL